MQKREKKIIPSLKKLNYTNKNFKAKFKGKINTKKEKRKKKAFLKIKKLLSRKSYGIRSSLEQKLTLAQSKVKIWRHLSIKVKLNNIFVSLNCLKMKRTLFSVSTGKYKMKVSKKSIRFFIKPLLIRFFKDTKPFFKKSFLFVTIVSPLRLRKAILRLLQQNFFKNQKIIIKFLDKKCYNGCRVSKKIRKKRKRLRFLKPC